ncbi:MAG TPA: M48 family metallopeptidase, partial [Acidobacteriota bacterium]|nr:M48 family metallopeptidase [Acidobacteriota bacterium]
MNIYAIIILIAVVGRFIIEVISERLNIRSLSAPLPAELQGLYDETKYRNSQEYTKTRSQFHLIESTFGIAVLLLFWFAGGFNHADRFARGFELSPLWTGIVYIGILALASNLLSLPFSLYSTFVIEEKFGFNKTTPRTFILDRLKALMLTLILGVPVLALILWFFGSAGPHGWLYAWAAVFSFSLIVQFLAPAWIMPLFNKFTPLQEWELKGAISGYAKSVRFSFKDIFVVDGSRRSTKPNAFFTGFGRSKRIALFDTLVAEHSIPEV